MAKEMELNMMLAIVKEGREIEKKGSLEIYKSNKNSKDSSNPNKNDKVAKFK